MKKGGLIFPLLILLVLGLSYSATAIDVVILNHKNEPQQNIYVEIEDGWETYEYMTDNRGFFNTTLSEGWYYIHIEYGKEGYSGYVNYTEEIYLSQGETNFIKCDLSNNIPAFETLTFLVAVIGVIFIMRKR